MRALSTGELVRCAAGGDQSAWNELVRRYGRLVHAIAQTFHLPSTDRDDVFQVVMLRFAQHLGRLRDPERAGAWLATTTRNECLRLIRSSQRVVLTETFDIADDGPESVEGVVEKAEQLDALMTAFARLSPDDQALLRRIVDPDCSYEQICQELGMALGSIGPTRGRALRRLRTHFDAVYERGRP